MYEEPKYVYYRNKRIPGWWAMYLPDEQNPYKKTDTLTLEKGCLAEYWHIHSSNKHPNYRGAEACNFVHDMIHERFGGTFITPKWHLTGGRQGEKSYHEPKHIVYDNAYIGDDGMIHIKNARQYYEDVIIFVQNVLREVARNHYQSGNDYDASEFFPHATDAEIERSRIEHEKMKLRTEEYRKELEAYVASDCFSIDDILFERFQFSAHYDFGDGWFNEMFSFGAIKTNELKGNISLVIDVPHLYGANHNRKNRAMATKTLDIPYCMYFHGNDTKDKYSVRITVPKNKVSAGAMQKINDACNQAMENYNKENMDIIENKNTTPVYKYYPNNFFLDNQIGRLNLVYKENAGKGSWRMRFW